MSGHDAGIVGHDVGTVLYGSVLVLRKLILANSVSSDHKENS
jgi:hypothetical protein